MTIGQVIRKVRIEKGFRLEDIAIMTNFDTSTISRIENRERVDLEKVVAIADALGSNEPLKVACRTCPIYSQLFNCNCNSKTLLN